MAATEETTEETTAALRVRVVAPVVSFRDPLYAGVQVGLPCPPPATVGGMLAAAAGNWQRVDPVTRFAMCFTARGDGVDLETYHPLEARGRSADPTPRERAFLAGVELTVWLFDDLDRWWRRLRRPAWPLRLGRSQDLVAVEPTRTTLWRRPGRQQAAVVPAGASERGTLMRLPTAVSPDRARTRWDSYRYDVTSRADARVDTDESWSTEDGQAVVPLPPTHPTQLATAAGVRAGAPA